ncbi:hypothetical protein ACLOJK_031672 [Asimina triloba]
MYVVFGLLMLRTEENGYGVGELKLSLQYHPDKNKSKGAQEKFADINNAYEILSDEEKRKNYDLYGDEKGNPGFDGSNHGNQEGYTHFTSGGHGNTRFSFRPDGWQNMGGQGNTKSFSFSFGNAGASGGPFGFGLNDIFSNMFGGDMSGGKQFGGFSSSGSINCESEQSLCKDLGVRPSKSTRLYVYSYRKSEKGSLVEYTGDLDAKSLKIFCQDHLPNFSKRVDLRNFDFSKSTMEDLPQVLLLSTKKDTPVVWSALSGLYHKRFVFYDAEVSDASHPIMKRLGVNVLPAVIGMLSNGEKHVLRTGSIKDLKSGISELTSSLNSFEKKNKVASSQTKRPSQSETEEYIPHLTSSNMGNICGDETALCIIGIHRSSKAKEELESILHAVSQKTFSRQQKDSVRYSLLDATKQQTFLKSFDKTGFKSSGKLLLAYKPRKGKFAVLKNAITFEEVERFISSVLNGDIQFSKVNQKPIIR